MSTFSQPVTTSVMGDHQELALFAFRHHLRRCSDIRFTDLPVEGAVGHRGRWLDDYADHLLLALRLDHHLGTDPHDVIEATRLLTDPSSDLSCPPDLSTHGTWGDRYTHDCPLCTLPARHHRQHPTSICHDCLSHLATRDGTLVSLSGARPTDTWARGVEVAITRHNSLYIAYPRSTVHDRAKRAG